MSKLKKMLKKAGKAAAIAGAAYGASKALSQRGQMKEFLKKARQLVDYNLKSDQIPRRSVFRNMNEHFCLLNCLLQFEVEKEDGLHRPRYFPYSGCTHRLRSSIRLHTCDLFRLGRHSCMTSPSSADPDFEDEPRHNQRFLQPS